MYNVANSIMDKLSRSNFLVPQYEKKMRINVQEPATQHLNLWLRPSVKACRREFKPKQGSPFDALAALM